MGARTHHQAPNTPFFVTSVTKGRRPVFLEPNAANLFLEVLEDFPLLTPQPETSLATVTRINKGRSARAWNRATGSSGSVWQARVYESGVWTQDQLRAWVRYIEANPVEAGLVEDELAEDWSSAGTRLALDGDAYFDGSWPNRTPDRTRTAAELRT